MINFQFPICLLNMEDVENKLSQIISFSIVNEAKKIPEQAIETEFYEPEILPNDFENKIYHKKIIFVAERKGIALGSINSTIRRYEKARNFIENFSENYFTKNKNHMWSKAPKNLVFQARDGNYDINKLQILAAVNGILGNNALYKRITISRIQAGAAGFKSHKILPDNIKTLPYKKTIRITNKLEASGWFAKYTYNNRVTYYSTKIKDFEKLARKIETKHTLKKRKKEKQKIKKKVKDEIKGY